MRDHPTVADGTIAAIGAEVLVRGLVLAGVVALPAEDPDAVRDAWRRLPPDVGLVLLTPAAAAALGDEADRGWPLVAVMPDAE
jgi:vacuolar-type H+-ATPase subunit F/Vma7